MKTRTLNAVNTVTATALLLLGCLALASPRAAAGGNGCPTASPQSVSVAMSGMVNFNLIASDPDNDPLMFMVTQPPAHGSLVVATLTGAATYSASPGYCGPDSFRFRVTDGTCQSNEATVIVTVCPPPTATPTQTPTVTPTQTPTQTPTNTPRAIGDACTAASQCVLPFCVDGVCCDSACDALDEACNLPTSLGMCVSLTGAPTLSWPAMLAGGCLLLIIAARRLRPWPRR